MLTSLSPSALLCAMAALLLASCSKTVIEEIDGDTPPTDGTRSATLTVRPRTATADDEPQVAYPVAIYAFAADGTCSAVATLASAADTTALMSLAPGQYRVCAIGGADAYDMPTQGQATLGSVLEPLGPHADLMTAQGDVTLAAGSQNALTLALQRRVMLIEQAQISDVPATVTAVSITLSPLYGAITIGGDYCNGGASHTIALQPVAGTGTWQSTEQAYLLEPSASAATITVAITTAGGATQSYAYTCSDELLANYRISISGTYTLGGDVELRGTLQGATWAGQRTIAFTFGQDGQPGGDTHEPGGDVSGQVPQVGTLYMDSYFVVRTQPASGGTEVLLMAMAEADQLSVNGVDQGEVAQLAQAVINEIMADDMHVASWRLPTQSEIEYIDQNFGELQDMLISHGLGLTASSQDYYFYLTDQGTVSSFSFGSRQHYTMLGNWTKLRPVATLVVN